MVNGNLLVIHLCIFMSLELMYNCILLYVKLAVDI